MESQNHVTYTMNTQMQPLPNATGVLVLGIVSIAMCWCYGIVSIATGIIALVLAGKANKIYSDSPGAYSEASYKNMKAGRICAIIGLALSAIYLVFIVIYIMVIGATLTTMPWDAILNNM